MAPTDVDDFCTALRAFAASLTKAFSSQLKGQPEDQLKMPTQKLLDTFSPITKREVTTKTESSVAEVGRPDIAVATDGLLNGHVELKAPGTGADAERFKGRNKEQWDKFKSLPNLIYTDGNEWTLYRTGEAKARVALSGDVRSDGIKAVTGNDASNLRRLLLDFLLWNPIVPKTPKGLAEMLAPLCHLLRDDVLHALRDTGSNLLVLAREWRAYLFPDADDAQFADAYAQTLTYALLLARFSGATNLDPDAAASVLRRSHGLLAQTLRVLGDHHARAEISLGVDLLERSIGAVEPREIVKSNPDPWLYFYEDFLAAYDPKLRNNRGVYYTPVEVVQAQVRLISGVLVSQFGKPLSYADEDVVVLDPAAGTGTYPLAALQHGLELVGQRFGPGAVGPSASEMARNIHAFEILVGSYAVAHLRLSERILDAGGSLPSDGVHVYLTDTLESPYAVPGGQLPLIAKELAEEHRRALNIKENTRVLVCLGNPPYDRQQIDPRDEGIEPKGGWVRYGDKVNKQPPILEDFLAPARRLGAGGHLKNLYNDYVYFWRWALWKVFETSKGPGVVSFITASSYLRGPGFVGMREAMRRLLDELWIIDLEGDSIGARKTQNVFAIRTPVAIALGVRYGDPKPAEPARVHYAKVTGSRVEKLHTLGRITSFSDLSWADCFTEWTQPFLPKGVGDYFAWPLLTDLFPWQQSGVKVGRTWPVAPDVKSLQARWTRLVSSSSRERAQLFKDSPTGKKHTNRPAMTRLPVPASDVSIAGLDSDAPIPSAIPYGYRSFDRQWLLADNRLIDRASPALWQAHSNAQVYMVSLLTKVLGLGPAVTVSAELPDLDYFSNRGGKDIIPLWRDAAATEPNVTQGLLNLLSEHYGDAISAEDLFAYTYGTLVSQTYVSRFSEELTIPGPRIPLTKDRVLFRRGTEFGRQLIHLHTYGARLGASSIKGVIPQGRARMTKAIPSTPEGYPDRFHFSQATMVLHVGEGEIGPVAPEVWAFSISGLQVAKSWLAYRVKGTARRSSSSLDRIGPERWTARMTVDLLELLWVLEATISQEPALAELLNQIIQGELFTVAELPRPSESEQEAPHLAMEEATSSQLMLKLE